MTSIASAATPASLSLTASSKGTDREQLAGAAKQFEAIFVRQMLAAARKTSFGEDMFGSQAMETFRQMQDDHFADVTAQTGSLGLAAQIEAQLARLLPPTSAPAAGTATTAKER